MLLGAVCSNFRNFNAFRSSLAQQNGFLSKLHNMRSCPPLLQRPLTQTAVECCNGCGNCIVVAVLTWHFPCSVLFGWLITLTLEILPRELQYSLSIFCTACCTVYFFYSSQKNFCNSTKNLIKPIQSDQWHCKWLLWFRCGEASHFNIYHLY